MAVISYRDQTQLPRPPTYEYNEKVKRRTKHDFVWIQVYGKCSEPSTDLDLYYFTRQMDRYKKDAQI